MPRERETNPRKGGQEPTEEIPTEEELKALEKKQEKEQEKLREKRRTTKDFNKDITKYLGMKESEGIPDLEEMMSQVKLTQDKATEATQEGVGQEKMLETMEDMISEYRELGTAYRELRLKYEESLKEVTTARDLLDVEEDKQERIEALQAQCESHEDTIAELQQGGRNSPTRKLSKAYPDPPALTDGVSPLLDDWIIDMRAKLRRNADHFPTSAHEIDYVTLRIQLPARNYIRTQLANETFTTPNDIFKTLQQALGKSVALKRQEARTAWTKLYQNSMGFSQFWAEMQRLAMILEKDEREVLEELRERINLSMKRQMLTERTDDLNEFVEICGLYEAKLKSIENEEAKISKRRAYVAPVANKGNQAPHRYSPPAANTSGPAMSNRRPFVKREISNPGPRRCYGCQSEDHIQRNCPLNNRNGPATGVNRTPVQNVHPARVQQMRQPVLEDEEEDSDEAGNA